MKSLFKTITHFPALNEIIYLCVCFEMLYRKAIVIFTFSFLYFIILVKISGSTNSTQQSNSSFLFKTKCLEGLGCFYNGPPFYHSSLRPISFLPDDPYDLNTTFRLYTSPNQWTILQPNNDSLLKSFYNYSQGIKILIHGDSTYFEFNDIFNVQHLVDSLVKANDSNIILVDWTAGISRPYFQVVANARVVAAQIAQLIEFLQNTVELDPKNVHIIGHSVGAHIGGWTGERIRTLGRITGLDPAGPYFRKGIPEIFLDSSDAEFVDIIHSSAAGSVTRGLGINEATGDIDFFINDGNTQPGCISITYIPFMSSLAENVCNHLRSIEIFNASINAFQCQFIGTQCKSYQKFSKGKCNSNKKALMGLYAKKDKTIPARSKFYVSTSGEYPFCLKIKKKKKIT